MSKRILLAAFAIGVCFSTFGASVSRAEESTINKMKDGVGDATTNTKKLVRKGNRKLRKATGNDTVMKDVKDKANDVSDDVNNGADKMKRKTESN
jgi:hypothetical protein